MYIKFTLLVILTIYLHGCAETSFVINSAKRLGSSWTDKPTYKIGDPYKINGKWYYPALNYEYDEIGLASWYGPDFHGKKTANGEIFDQNKISAAHKTLPMPSIIKITNLDNGISLDNVRLNDRGPFVRGRIIDLSKKAAEELGFFKNGVARVRVQILEDESREVALSYQNNLKDENVSSKAETARVAEVKKEKLKDEFSINNDQNLTKKKTYSPIEIDFPEDAERETSKKELQEKEINFSENLDIPIKKLPKNKEIYYPSRNGHKSEEDQVKNKQIFYSNDKSFGGANIEIQVGAFMDRRNADSLIKKLSNFEAYIKRDLENEKYMYKVRIGPIENINIANSIKKKLGELGFSTISLIMK